MQERHIKPSYDYRFLCQVNSLVGVYKTNLGLDLCVKQETIAFRQYSTQFKTCGFTHSVRDSSTHREVCDTSYSMDIQHAELHNLFHSRTF